MDVIRRPQHGDLDLDAVRAALEGRLEIVVEEQAAVEPRIDQYPYEGQTEYRGSLTYTEVHPAPQQPDLDMVYKFIYRDESGLFFIYEEESGYEMPLYDVVRRLNTSLHDDRLAAPSFPREALWSLAFAATERTMMTVYDSGNREEEIQESQHEITSDLIEDHLLDQVTLDFEYENEVITVDYSEGSISFHEENVSRQGMDYVLQLVEKFLISGQISDEVQAALEQHE